MPIIQCPVAKHAKTSPDTIALYSDNDTLTYKSLHENINIVHGCLLKLGVTEGQHVAVISNDKHIIIELLFATIRLGAVLCIINPALPKKYQESLLNRANIAFCFNFTLSELNVPYVYSYTDINNASNSVENTQLSTHQITTLLATSGSTGVPKLAMHSLGNHYYSAIGSNDALELKNNSIWHHTLPLYHVSGLSILFRCLLQGAGIFLPTDTKTLNSAISPTHLSCVSTQLIRYLDNLSSIKKLQQYKVILLGGSAVSESIIQNALECKLPLFYSYGLTEMSSMVTCKKVVSTKLNCSGKAINHREIKLTEKNEILVKGDTLFKGYFDKNTVTLPLSSDGWFHTGDLGILDSEGHIKIKGRIDRQFISGGENIQPEEIERVINNFPNINTSYIMSESNSEFGHIPIAIIDYNKDFNISKFRDFLKSELPSFKRPKRFYNYDFTKNGLKPNQNILEILIKEKKLKTVAINM